MLDVLIRVNDVPPMCSEKFTPSNWVQIDVLCGYFCPLDFFRGCPMHFYNISDFLTVLTGWPMLETDGTKNPGKERKDLGSRKEFNLFTDSVQVFCQQ